LLAAFGLVLFAQSPEGLRAALPGVREDTANEPTGLARLALPRALLPWIELDVHLAWCDERITAHAKTDARARAAMQLPGIGPITASALVASVEQQFEQFEQFDDVRRFGPWLGLLPSQDSSGGKNELGGVHKRGDPYLRTLLVAQVAHSAVQTSPTQRPTLALGAGHRPSASGAAGKKACVAPAHTDEGRANRPGDPRPRRVRRSRAPARGPARAPARAPSRASGGPCGGAARRHAAPRPA
jgi:transposase